MAKLYFYYSSMNAGKTTTLLQSNYNYHERGMNTLLFSPCIDTRYEVGQIVSRIGIEAKALPFDAEFDFFTAVQGTEHYIAKRLHCILLDEAHFLTKQQVRQLCTVVDELKVPVLTYGLRTDFLGEPFEGSRYLLTWADELIEIKGVCHCGHKATMNLRLDASGKAVTEGTVIEIGGNERYVALCRKHFNQALTQALVKKSETDATSA